MPNQGQYSIMAPAPQDGCAAGIGFGIFTAGAWKVRRAVKRPLVQAVQNVQDWQERYVFVCSGSLPTERHFGPAHGGEITVYIEYNDFTMQWLRSKSDDHRERLERQGDG